MSRCGASTFEQPRQRRPREAPSRPQSIATKFVAEGSARSPQPAAIAPIRAFEAATFATTCRS